MRKGIITALVLCLLPALGDAQIRYHREGEPFTLGGVVGGIRYIPPSGAAPSTLLNGLVSYWNLNEESGTRADSVGSNNLSDNNTVGFTAGVNSNAASFVAASTEWLSVDDNASLSMAGSFTWNMWAKINGTSARFFIGKDQSGGREIAIGQGNASGSPAFTMFLFNAAEQFIQPILAASADEWHMFTVRYDVGTGKVTLNVDAAANDPWPLALAGAVADTATPLNFGRRSFVGSNGYFNGPLDEVGLWSRMLTDPELAELYNAGAGKFYPF